MNPASGFTPRVWAPEKTTVELIIQVAGTGLGDQAELAEPINLPPSLAFSGEHRRVTMHPMAGGWWESPESLAPGDFYGFCLDGGPFHPDPCSRFQPEGVHSWSEVWIPDSTSREVPKSPESSKAPENPEVKEAREAREAPHRATTTAPGSDFSELLGKVFYELHVGTFTPEGSFAAAATKLADLKALGVEVVELMPLAAFEGDRGWGYDSSDFFAPFAPYGTPPELTDFVRAAHELGLAVCLDLVLNHASARGCYLSAFGPYFSFDETLWGDAFDIPKVSGESNEALAFLTDSALWWLEAYGFDALRLDAIHAIDAPRRKVLLDAIAAQLPALEARSGRRRTLIAESDLNDAGLLEELHLDGLWDDDFHHALHCLFTGESGGYYADFADREAFTKVMAEVYFHNGTFSTFRGQIWGEPVSPRLPREHFVVFSSNHDQVGNRALGDRPASYLPSISVAALAALTLLSPFTPMLFMGEEFGALTPFQFFADPEGESDAIAIREGRAEEFSRMWTDSLGSKAGDTSVLNLPDPTDIEAFRASKLDWSEAETPRGEAFRRWYFDLLALRRRQRAGEFLSTSAALPSARWEGEVLVMENAGISVLVNFGEIPLAAQDSLMDWQDYAPASEPPNLSPEATKQAPTQLLVLAL